MAVPARGRRDAGLHPRSVARRGAARTARRSGRRHRARRAPLPAPRVGARDRRRRRPRGGRGARGSAGRPDFTLERLERGGRAHALLAPGQGRRPQLLGLLVHPLQGGGPVPRAGLAGEPVPRPRRRRAPGRTSRATLGVRAAVRAHLPDRVRRPRGHAGPTRASPVSRRRSSSTARAGDRGVHRRRQRGGGTARLRAAVARALES